MAAEADGHGVVGGVAQELQHVLTVGREAPVDLGTVDCEHGVTHCGEGGVRGTGPVSHGALRPGPAPSSSARPPQALLGALRLCSVPSGPGHPPQALLGAPRPCSVPSGPARFPEAQVAPSGPARSLRPGSPPQAHPGASGPALTSDAVSLPEGDDDPLVSRAQDEVEGVAEGLLGVAARHVVVQLVDEAARLVHHVDAEDRHGAALPPPSRK